MATQEEKIIISVDLDPKVLQQRLGEVRTETAKYRKDMADLKKEMAGLDQGSEKYAELAQKIGENERSVKALTREASTLNQALDGAQAVIGSYNKIAAEAAVLEKQLKESAVGVNITAEAYEDLIVKVKAANDAKLEFSQTINDLKGQIGSYPKIVDLSSASLDALKAELRSFAELKDQSPINSEEFKEANKRIAELEATISSASAEIVPDVQLVAGSLDALQAEFEELSRQKGKLPIGSAQFEETKSALDALRIEIDKAEGKIDEFGNREPKNAIKKGYDDATDAVNGFVAASTLVTLIGGKNKKTDETQAAALKSLAIMQAVVNLRKGIQGAIDTVNLVVTKLTTKATQEQTVAQEQLNTTMAANPIGAIVVALIALVAIIGAVVSAFMEANSESAKQEAIYDRMKKSVEAMNAVAENQIEILEAQGDKEEEILQIKRETLVRNIELAKQAVKIDQMKLKEIETNDSLYESFLKMAQAVQDFLGMEKEAAATQLLIDQNKKERAEEVLASLTENQKLLDDLITDSKVLEINAINDAADAAKVAADKKADYARQLADVQNRLIADQMDREIKSEQTSAARAIAAIEGNGKTAIALRSALAEESEKKIQAIRDKFSKEEIDKRNEVELEKFKLELALLKENSKAKLDATVELLDKQKTIELAKVKEGTATTLEEKANIEEKYRQEKLKAEEAFNDKLEEELTRDRMARLAADVTNAEIAGANALAAKKALALAERDEQLKNDALTAGERIKIEADYQKKVVDLNKEAQDQKLEDAQKTSDMMIGFIGATTNYFKEQQHIETDARVSALDAQLAAGLLSQSSYDAQRKTILRNQAKNDKELAIFDATIAGIAAVVKALPNIPLSILAGVTSGLQISLLASKPIPNFALSGKLIGYNDGTPVNGPQGDNRLAYVRTGEVILNERHQALLGGDSTFAAIGVPGFADGGMVGRVASIPVEQSFNLQNQFRAAVESLPPSVLLVEDFSDVASDMVKVKSRADV